MTTTLVLFACFLMGIIGGTAPIWWDWLTNIDHVHKYGIKYEEVSDLWVRKCTKCHKVKYYY